MGWRLCMWSISGRRYGLSGLMRSGRWIGRVLLFRVGCKKGVVMMMDDEAWLLWVHM